MHPELNWLGFPLSGHRGRGPCRHPLGLDFSQPWLSVDSESPRFGCTWLRSLSRGWADLKPGLLTVPRQAIFENNLEKVGLQGRVLVDFPLSHESQSQSSGCWIPNCITEDQQCISRPGRQLRKLCIKEKWRCVGDKEFLCYQHVINRIAQGELSIRSTAKVCCSYSTFYVSAPHLHSVSALLQPSLTHYSICQRWPLWPHLPSAYWHQPWKA